VRDGYVYLNGSVTRWGRPSIIKDGYTPVAVEPFIYESTKPSAKLCGVGTYVESDGITIRPAPTVTFVGDKSITTAGFVLENLIIKGKVTVSAADVIIRNCFIMGGINAPTVNSYLVKTSSGLRVKIQHSTLRPQTPSLYWNAIGERNYIAERNNISRITDGFSGYSLDTDPTQRFTKIQILGNYCHDMVQFRPDLANNSRQETHNDWYQGQDNVKDVNDVIIRGNWFNARHEFAVDANTGAIITSNNLNRAVVMLSPRSNGSATYNSTCSMTFNGNWADGGVYTINAGGTNPGGMVTAKNNRFERPSSATYGDGTSGVNKSLVLDDGIIRVDISGNIYSDNGEPVSVSRG